MRSGPERKERKFENGKANILPLNYTPNIVSTTTQVFFFPEFVYSDTLTHEWSLRKEKKKY
jgi:hypothetical protein